MRHPALLQVIEAKGAGNQTIRRLAELDVDASMSPAQLVAMRPAEIASALAIKEGVASSIHAAEEAAERLAQELDARGVDLLWLNDRRYPERLKAILGRDAPPTLFARGNQDLLDLPAVSFCGSRKASPKGIDVTRRAARLLAEHGVCVVSGYAHGVDLAAHRGALEAGGTTILVLAEGILRFQVKEDIRELLTDSNHLVISQYPPKLPWIARNAMRRNATIIGLSDAMILVESGMRGGTFAAGTEALRRRHPLFVVDFAHPGPSAEANPHFVQRGGVPVRSKQDGLPNLESVFQATQQPRWHSLRSQGVLFE
jgi:DNA protecting protein DprA